MNENTERLARVETSVEHIEKKVDAIGDRQINHEQSTSVSFSELRETAIRQQVITENLVKAIQEQNTRHVDQDEKLSKRVGVVEERLTGLTTKVIAITVGGGLLWVLLGKKILTVLGLA